MESDDPKQVIEAQRQYFSTGKTRSWSARKEALGRLEHVLVNHRDEILAALSKDLGKPDVEAYLAEYYFLLQELRMIRKSLKKWLKTRRVGSPFYFQPCRSEIRNDPFGVVLILAPWNYPIQLALSPLIAAVAAGNTVVLKPSEMAPACESLLVKLVREAFDSKHVTTVVGDGGVADRLLDEPFDFIFFTGSTQVGRIVASKAAKHLTPHILELGGKCPCVVDSTVDVNVAASRILTGKFFNGGQTCFAPDFVVVHQSVKEKLIEAFRSLLKEVPWNQEMARVINERHYQRIMNLIPDQVIQFGDDDAEKLRIAPRLLTQVGWDDEVMQEEIFGPLLPILEFTHYDELLKQLGKYQSPLALYVFSQDGDMQQRLMRDMRSGGVCINDTMKQGSSLDLPFGGVGESGYGRYRGRAGLMAFSYERAVVKRPFWAPEWFSLMPPYEGTVKWLKRFMR